MTESSNGGGGSVVDTSTLIARINLVSHATVRSAVERLQQDHAIDDPDTAFRALHAVSRRFDVKLRHVAAAVLADDSDRVAEASTAPALPFSSARGGRPVKRSVVLNDLLSAALNFTTATKGAVHLRHDLHGGLCIESHLGLGDGYRRHFSYVDDGGSAAGRAMARSRPVRLDDVATSHIYTRADAAVLADEGIRAELAVPMIDEFGREWGALAVQFTGRHPRVDPYAVDILQGHADACAQWLRWYERAVTPRVVAAVHDYAARPAGAVVPTAVAPAVMPA